MGKFTVQFCVSLMSFTQPWWDSIGSTLTAMGLTPRFWNSPASAAVLPSSVVHTGVKSAGCENSTTHELPAHSWKWIGPAVDSWVKSGAVSPRRRVMALPPTWTGISLWRRGVLPPTNILFFVYGWAALKERPRIACSLQQQRQELLLQRPGFDPLPGRDHVQRRDGATLHVPKRHGDGVHPQLVLLAGHAEVLLAHFVDHGAEAARVRDRVPGQARQQAALHPGGEVRLAFGGQQHAAGRGRVGGQARAQV